MASGNRAGRLLTPLRVRPGTNLDICPWCNQRGGTKKDDLGRAWHADCMEACSPTAAVYLCIHDHKHRTPEAASRCEDAAH